MPEHLSAEEVTRRFTNVYADEEELVELRAKYDALAAKCERLRRVAAAGRDAYMATLSRKSLWPLTEPIGDAIGNLEWGDLDVPETGPAGEGRGDG